MSDQGTRIHRAKQWSLTTVWGFLSVLSAFSSRCFTCPHAPTWRDLICFVLTLVLCLTFILRNSCKMKQNQLMQKDFSGQVCMGNVSAAHFLSNSWLMWSWRTTFSQCGWLCSLLLKDDHHGGHATDEEKLASSASVKPDKDQSSE